MKTAYYSFVLALPTWLGLLDIWNVPDYMFTIFLPVAAVLGFFALGLAAFATDIPVRRRWVIGCLSLPALLAVVDILYVFARARVS